MMLNKRICCLAVLLSVMLSCSCERKKSTLVDTRATISTIEDLLISSEQLEVTGTVADENLNALHMKIRIGHDKMGRLKELLGGIGLRLATDEETESYRNVSFGGVDFVQFVDEQNNEVRISVKAVVYAGKSIYVIDPEYIPNYDRLVEWLLTLDKTQN